MKWFKRSFFTLVCVGVWLGAAQQLVWADPSEETPAFVGVIVEVSEIAEEVFYLLQIGENEDDHVWVRVTGNSDVFTQFGQSVEDEVLPIGTQMVVLCYIDQTVGFIDIIEALVFVFFDDEESGEEP